MVADAVADALSDDETDTVELGDCEPEAEVLPVYVEDAVYVVVTVALADGDGDAESDGVAVRVAVIDALVVEVPVAKGDSVSLLDVEDKSDANADIVAELVALMDADGEVVADGEPVTVEVPDALTVGLTVWV